MKETGKVALGLFAMLLMFAFFVIVFAVALMWEIVLPVIGIMYLFGMR